MRLSFGTFARSFNDRVNGCDGPAVLPGPGRRLHRGGRSAVVEVGPFDTIVQWILPRSMCLIRRVRHGRAAGELVGIGGNHRERAVRIIEEVL